MKQLLKITLSIPILILLLILPRCNSNGRQEESRHREDSSKTAKMDSHSFTEEDSLRFFSPSISITGEVETPLILTVDSLKKMGVATLDSSNIVCQSGAIMNQSKSSRGVLLKDILNKAGLHQQNHKDRNFYIVARASDGYKATFSWAELFNNPTGEHTYVIFEENNRPLTKKGAMMLNSNSDIKTGPRHVNWLKSIEVKRVD